MSGRYVHDGLVSKSGLFVENSAVGSSFVFMYSKCGSMGDACLVFDEIIVKDVVAWTALVIGYVQNGESEKVLECLCDMHKVGEDGEKRSNFRTLEKACANLCALDEGKCLHGFVVKTGLGFYPVVQSSILSMYSRCGSVGDSYASFSEVDGLCVDGFFISSILLGFGNFTSVRDGKVFHGLIIRRNFVLDQLVHNALLFMYCKFGLLSRAEKLFSVIHNHSKESWTIMVHGYCKMGPEAKTIELFREMQQLGVEIDSNSLVSVIFSFSQLGAIRIGHSLHCQIVKSYMANNIPIANSLIDMYGKSENLTIAWRIVNQTQRDIITWNTMISAYTRCGHFSEAVALFDQMVLGNVMPNLATSCGQIEKSRELFNSMKQKDAVSWNVMISGYGMHGDAKSALQIFQQMEESNVKPNDLTFLSLLNSCSHTGLVEEGKFLFSRMEHYSVKPNLKHYACIVDILGRSGILQEAEALVMSMPVSPDGGVWGALLSACVVHNEIEMGIRIAKHAIDSDPENDGYYILISSLYSSMGWWEEAEQAREIMKERGVGKKAGWSANIKNTPSILEMWTSRSCLLFSESTYGLVSSRLMLALPEELGLHCSIEEKMAECRTSDHKECRAFYPCRDA
ncbi:hypothetical protein CRYUN_Cryun24cG0037500 [Craigia yunnanensis]